MNLLKPTFIAKIAQVIKLLSNYGLWKYNNGMRGAQCKSESPCTRFVHPIIIFSRSTKQTHWCSRLKASYEFHFEGLSNFSPSVKGLVQIQDVNSRI